MPALMAFKNGQKISEVVGAISDKLNVRGLLLFSSALLTMLYHRR
jgi:hypothetical protein